MITLNLQGVILLLCPLQRSCIKSPYRLANTPFIPRGFCLLITSSNTHSVVNLTYLFHTNSPSL